MIAIFSGMFKLGIFYEVVRRCIKWGKPRIKTDVMPSEQVMPHF